MKTVYVNRYGILPNTGKDQTALFYNMMQANKRNVSFQLDSGRYDFYAANAMDRDYYLSNSDPINPHKIALLFDGFQHVSLVGNDTCFVFHGQILPIAIDHCNDIQIQNLIIDWEIPLSAECKIIATAESSIDVEIDSTKFPYSIENGALYFSGEDWKYPLNARGLIEFDSVRQAVAYNTGDAFQNITAKKINNGLVRLTGDFSSVPQAGNYFVMRHNPRWHPGMFAIDSEDIVFQDIQMYANGGLGFLCQFCCNITFRRVHIGPNRTKGRHFVSGHDDGLHLSNNSGKILVEECSFFGLMDDPINVHGTALRIDKKLGETKLRGSFVHPQSIGMAQWAKPGQTVSFLNHRTMSSTGKAVVRTFRLLSPQTFDIIFDQPVPDNIQVGDALENLSNSPELVCQNNYFGSCRARGILISTPKPVLIEHNTFASSGAAILIAGDANNWYECGACTDVTIRRNVFEESCNTSDYQFCNAVISICPEIPEPDVSLPFHQNIRITDNDFYAWDYPLLYALCSKGISFTENRVYRSYAYPPRHDPQYFFSLDFCLNVQVEHNLFIGEMPQSEQRP